MYASSNMLTNLLNFSSTFTPLTLTKPQSATDAAAFYIPVVTGSPLILPVFFRYLKLFRPRWGVFKAMSHIVTHSK